MDTKDNSAKYCILVIDDERNIRTLFELNLQRLDYQVVLASDGEQAIELYTQAQTNNALINAVIVDLNLPGGMGGKEIAREIRAMDPQAKIIVSSGNTVAPEMEHPENHGFDGALEKNFNREKIKQMLEQVLMSG